MPNGRRGPPPIVGIPPGIPVLGVVGGVNPPIPGNPPGSPPIFIMGFMYAIIDFIF